MIDSFKYSNLKHQSTHDRVEYNPEWNDYKGDGPFQEKRDELLSKYGWVSPYEFYYGSATNSVDTDNNTVIDFDYIERLGAAAEGVEVADRSNVPNYFWCESLSNWCYFKVTAVVPNYERKDTWAPSFLRAFAAIATAGWTEILEEISTNGISWDLLWKAPVHIFTSYASGFYGMGYSAVAAISGSKDLQDRYDAVTLPFLIYNAVTTASKMKEADSEAENIIENYIPTDLKEILMPRMCISLYMWEGYKRTWIPVKSLMDTFTKITRRNSESELQQNIKSEFVGKILMDHGVWRSPEDRAEGIEAWLKAHILSEEGKDAFRNICRDFPPPLSETDTYRFIYQLAHTMIYDPEYTNGLIDEANVGTLEVFYLDCRCFEPYVGRTPLAKLQYIGVDNKDGHHWGEWHWIEQYGFWMPLPKDKAKLRLFAKNTFQLFNRQYSYIAHDRRDHVGWIHKNLGHPCFFRGNDNELWMSYWLRWTSGYGSEDKSGWMWSETTKMSGEYDISKDDIALWDDIINTMFEKHDDYGYDEWLVNGEYGLTYKKFTVNEEQPNEILTADDSSLNPDKAPLANSIEETPENTMILSLSTGTVISRDDDNSTIDTAQRWK